MVRIDIGIEINTVGVDQNFAEKAGGRELMQGIVDRRQRNARAVFAHGGVNLLGRHVFVAAVEQDRGQRKALARRAHAGRLQKRRQMIRMRAWAHRWIMAHTGLECNAMDRVIHGKIAGAFLGFMFGGPVGAALGVLVGHAHDVRSEADSLSFLQRFRGQQRGFAGKTPQAAFTMGVIVLGAKMAKADGRVTTAEIDAFKRVFNIQESQVAGIGVLFDQARKSAGGFEPYAFQVAQVHRNSPAVLEEVLSGLFIIAASDSNGVISQPELEFLERVAVIFDFTTIDFGRIAARAGVRFPGGQKPRDESYAILGLPEDATPEVIKTTYRALIRKHHPDKLVSQGMPPEFIATATEKMKRINGAYDTICRAKGIK
jgi:DnaJ like chaperone protein